MPTTTNNGWTTPADTDLVSQGASAIRTLGNAIDTTLGVYVASSPGLNFISSTTIGTTVASVSVNDCFSATYKNYKIVFTTPVLSTAGETLRIRMRVSGADASGSVYKYLMKQVYAGGFDELSSTGATEFIVHRYTRADGIYESMEMYNPFATNYTGLYNTSFTPNYNVTEGAFTYASTNVTTSYTGFTVYPSAGTMTGGTIKVYGYKD